MTRFKQYTTLDPPFVADKLQEFLKEDNIQEDITTISTQEDNKEAPYERSPTIKSSPT